MKAIKILIFTLASVMSLVSCHQEKAQHTNQQTTQEVAKEKTTEVKELSPKEILAMSIEKCKAISSIEYAISQKGVPGKFGYGQPEIKATIIQQKNANTKDIGFDKAFIKATGFIIEKKNKTPFSFSYDGEKLIYKKGGFKQKSISNPTRSVTMGKLQQHLFMMRVFPFVEDEPFKMPAKSNNYNIKLLGREDKQGISCYKIETSIVFKAPNGQDLITRNIWWISETDYLPKAYSDGFVYKDIIYKRINENIPKHLFSLNNEKTTTDHLTSQQVENELAKENLLPIGIKPSKWTAKDQFGEKQGSEKLKGKVVLIDFWGSWCSPCLLAMPDIQKLQDYYENNPNVAIIGISASEKDNRASAKLFNEKGYNYILIPNGDEIAKQIYKVQNYPTLYILDKQGQIVSAEKGFTPNSFGRWKKIIDDLL